MYELTDETERVLLAEADTIANARYAARTIADEGTPCPILIQLDGRTRERLVEGPRGRMIQSDDTARSLL